MVAFDSNTINEVYGMPDYEFYGYRTLMGSTVDYDDIMQYLCVQGSVWKLNVARKVVNFESKYLRHYAYEWFLIITSRLMTQITHQT